MTNIKTAFYPCCREDFLEPLEMLNGYVDEVVFCDPSSEVQSAFLALADSSPKNLPKAHLVSDGARRGVETLERIDVLFYRRDGTGGGGSDVLVLAKPFLPTVLNKMPPEGGLIITDGSNRGNHYYQKTFRTQGVTKFGYHLCALPPAEQPFEKEGLHVIKVVRV